MRATITCFLASLALLTLCGCGAMPGSGPKEVNWVEQGESATKATADLTTFVPGTWGVKLGDLDPAFAKQLGLESLVDQNNDSAPSQFYTFNSDGTFVYFEKGKKWNFGGKWTTTEMRVVLSLETMDGAPVQQKMDELNKEAEGGGQASVARDLFMDQTFEALQKRSEFYVVPGESKMRFGKVDANSAMSSDLFFGSLVRMREESK